jgi:hypothetical protein
MLHRGVICLGGRVVFAPDCERIDLEGRNLNEDELLPLLESFKEKWKLWKLHTLNLVILFAFDVTAAHSHSCAAEWKWYRR